MDPIYLDANATAPIFPEVEEAMRAAERDGFGNPASQHFAGRRARRLVEDARERIGVCLGAQTGGSDADGVLFTSGGTEANNLAIRGLSTAANPESSGATAGHGPRGQIIVSPVEHASVRRVAESMGAAGWEIGILPVDGRGLVASSQLAAMLCGRTRLVSVMMANHEIGTLQPTAELASVCRDRGAWMHTDASQAVGKIPIDFRRIGVAALSFSAHKFHGPRGIGALVLRHDVTIAPLHHGGFQQGGRRPGTEPVGLVVGMCRALELFCAEQADRQIRLAKLRNRLESGIAAGWPRAVVVGAEARRVPNVSAIGLVGLDRQAVVMALDQEGIACSTGAACASGSSESSPTLSAMGCPETVRKSAVRFSLGAQTTAAEVDDAVGRIVAVCRRLGTNSRGGNRSSAPPPSPLNRL